MANDEPYGILVDRVAAELRSKFAELDQHTDQKLMLAAVRDTAAAMREVAEATRAGGGSSGGSKGSIPNYWSIPANTTTPWPDALKIIDEAGSAAAAGPLAHQTIVLPNKPMVQATHKQLPNFTTFCGSGPLSELITQKNLVDDYGMSCRLRAGWGGVIRDFKMTDDRAAMGSGGRCISIVVNARDVDIARMKFQDCTASCCYVGGGGNQNIRFRDNVANEFWEQFLELHGEIDGVVATGNKGRSTNSNPAIPSTEPCGLFIGNESGPAGDIKNILLDSNDIDLRGLPWEDQVSAFPCTLSDGGSHSWRYPRVKISNNTFRGGATGIRIQNLRNSGDPCTAYLIENTISDSVGEGIQLGLQSDDFVYLLDNIIHRRSGSSHPFWSVPHPAVRFIEDNNHCIQD